MAKRATSKTAWVQIRVQVEEREALKALAKERGTSVSRLLLDPIRPDLERLRAEHAERRESEPLAS